MKIKYEIGEDMTTYQKAKSIRSFIINKAAEAMCYESWTPEYCTTNIREIPAKALEKFGPLNIELLTESQMKELGFGKWDEKSQGNLIPLWLFPFLLEEIVTECIDGEKSILKKSEMDDDHRFGYLAYSVLPSIEEEK